MLTAGQQLELAIEKPAAGGRMIARHEGQVVLVLGAIPEERVLVRIDKVERQLAFATTLRVLVASADRREPHVDPLCGGCLYAHVTYPRQLTIKSSVIDDAFKRLGRIELPTIQVAASPERGYRMRGRLYVQAGKAGFYREGSHALCDAAATGLLSAAAVAIAVSFATALRTHGEAVRSVEINENIAGDQRALHVELAAPLRLEARALDQIVRSHGLTGCSIRGEQTFVVSEPSVSDPLEVLTSGRVSDGVLRRRAESFFQANRFLLPSLVSSVVEGVPAHGEVADLYAGVGLFAVALAGMGRTRITAVEGDRASGADLLENARQFPDSIRVVQGSVESFLSRGTRAETIIVDPPRTGISRAAMTAVAGLGARRIVYVSCDPPTMARDARRLVDASYELQSLRAFDFFPNTPHVESVCVFERAA